MDAYGNFWNNSIQVILSTSGENVYYTVSGAVNGVGADYTSAFDRTTGHFDYSANSHFQSVNTDGSPWFP